VNNLNRFSEPLNHADVYTIKYHLFVLPHEMCHAIGLSHPENRYHFYNIMGINDFYAKEINKNIMNISPDKFALVFDTWVEMDSFINYQQKLVIPLEERRVIKCFI